MLNLFNNNFSLFDNNLLSYTLLLGSLGIIGYSIYYFTGYFNNTNLDTTSLPNAETMNQRIVENLNNYKHLNLDNKVPSMSNFVDTVTQGTNTEVINLVDSSVQTDQKMLYEYLQELLYNNCTPTTSLASMEPETFAELLRNDPQGPAYLDKIQKWCDDVPSIISSNPGSQYSSEINFLREVLETMKTNINSGVENVSSSPISPISYISEHNNSLSIISPDYIEGIRSAKFEELLNDNSLVWNSYNKELLRIAIESCEINNLLLQSYNSEIIASTIFLSLGC
jgi:hypothetical protein